jgi:biopolymer transport protein ExbD
MKFPRNVRIFRGQLDAAPFAAVLFLLVIFLMLGSLVYTPGTHIQLPLADGLVGTEKRQVAVAVDANGRFYFQNQSIEENELKTRLRQVVLDSPSEPLALVVQADKAVTYEMFTRLAVLAQEAGISEAVCATLPRSLAAPGQHLVP